MSLEDTIINLIRRGVTSVRRLPDALPRHDATEIRAAVNRLLYRGKLQRVGRGRVALA